MSRNGFETDDEKRDASGPELDDAAHGASVSRNPPAKSRPKKSRPKSASKAKGPAKGDAKLDSKKGSRKSVAPRSRAQGAAVDLTDTIVIPASRNPATKIAAKLRKSDPDLISIPPADLDEHDEQFFADGEAASKRGEQLEPSARITGRASSSDIAERAHSPVVPPERRKKLANYVKMTVGISAVLCMAALVRVGLASGEHGTGGERSAAAAQIVSHGPVAHASPVAPSEPAKGSTALAVPTAKDGGDVAAIDSRDHVFTEQAVAAIPLKSAHEEREDARRALEHGKAKDAVEAATRSITVDATDAEAWLLLGAAQQESGHAGDAHQSFLACTKQAKTGPVGECSAMLRWNGPR